MRHATTNPTVLTFNTAISNRPHTSIVHQNKPNHNVHEKTIIVIKQPSKASNIYSHSLRNIRNKAKQLMSLFQTFQVPLISDQ